VLPAAYSILGGRGSITRGLHIGLASTYVD
jgi:hypothetical protein